MVPLPDGCSFCSDKMRDVTTRLLGWQTRPHGGGMVPPSTSHRARLHGGGIVKDHYGKEASSIWRSAAGRGLRRDTGNASVASVLPDLSSSKRGMEPSKGCWLTASRCGARHVRTLKNGLGSLVDAAERSIGDIVHGEVEAIERAGGATDCDLGGWLGLRRSRLAAIACGGQLLRDSIRAGGRAGRSHALRRSSASGLSRKFRETSAGFGSVPRARGVEWSPHVHGTKFLSRSQNKI